MDSHKEAVRQLILRLGKKKFGEPKSDDLKRLRTLVEKADDERLDEICDGLLDVSSWEDFLTEKG